jgi:P4 family phage/plasmid primase-like protien
MDYNQILRGSPTDVANTHGLILFPCDPETKEPRVKASSWLAYKPSSDREFDGYLTGCKVPEGVTVLDIDVKNIHEDRRREELDKALALIRVCVPEVCGSYTTRSGGAHIWCKGLSVYGQGLKLKGTGVTIDVKKGNAFVVVPPSQGYTTLPWLRAPEGIVYSDLAEYLVRPERPSDTLGLRAPQSAIRSPKAYLETAIKALGTELKAAKTNRNDTLNRCLFLALQYEEAARMLELDLSFNSEMVFSEISSRSGLSYQEIGKTAQSVKEALKRSNCTWVADQVLARHKEWVSEPKNLIGLQIGSHKEIAEHMRTAYYPNSASCEDKLWACHQDAVWRPVPDGDIYERCAYYDGAPYGPDSGKPRLFKMNYSDICAIIKTLKVFNIDGDFFKDAPKGVALKDTFIREDFVEEPLTPEHRVKFKLDFELSATPPKVMESAMDAWFEDWDDRDAIKTRLYETIGLTLLRAWHRVRDPQITLLLGGGSNGKSVFIQTLKQMIPEEAQANVSPSQMDNEYYLATLKDKVLNLGTELDATPLRATAGLKSITMFEHVQAREPYGKPFMLKPQCGHIFSANAIPESFDVSEGFFRRWLLVPFNQSFKGREDRELPDKLKREIGSIAYKAIEAAKSALTRGTLTPVETSRIASQMWALEENIVQSFLDDCVVVDSDMKTGMCMPLQEAYDIFALYAKAGGFNHGINVKRFKRALAQMGFNPRRSATRKNLYPFRHVDIEK